MASGKSQLEEYFRKYIVDVQGLKSSTASHYVQALSTCSRFLRDEKLIEADVYAGTRPVLVVNANLHRPNETVEALVRDRFFCALVLPEAYRQILRARLFGSGMIDKEDIWLRGRQA